MCEEFNPSFVSDFSSKVEHVVLDSGRVVGFDAVGYILSVGFCAGWNSIFTSGML